MPPACQTPRVLGETTARGGGNAEEEDKEVDVDALGMQLTISTEKPHNLSAAAAKGNALEGNGVVVEDESAEASKVLQVLPAVLDRLVARNEQFANSPS